MLKILNGYNCPTYQWWPPRERVRVTQQRIRLKKLVRRTNRKRKWTSTIQMINVAKIQEMSCLVCNKDPVWIQPTVQRAIQLICKMPLPISSKLRSTTRMVLTLIVCLSWKIVCSVWLMKMSRSYPQRWRRLNQDSTSTYSTVTFSPRTAISSLNSTKQR